MSAVSNCSPLRYFIAIGQADLIPATLGKITIPEAVFQELTHPSAPAGVRAWMSRLPDWLAIQTISARPAQSLGLALDPGEAEAIQLALETHPDFLLMDERLGRREAALHGIKTIGALGILLEAQRLGLLPEPLLALADLQTHGFRISRRLIDEFRSLASQR